MDNIEYEHLCQHVKGIDRETLDEIVDLLVETVCSARKTIRIAGDDYPAELVKSKFMKLDSSHIEFVFDCLSKNTSEIRNIKKYLLAMLFNAPSTINGYPQHFRHVAAEAVQADNIILHYEKGDREQPAGLYFDGRPDPNLGAFLRYEAKPNEPEHLRELLRHEQKGRAQLAPGDFKSHVTALHDSMILAEAQRTYRTERSVRPQQPQQDAFHGGAVPILCADCIQQGHRPAAFHAAL